MGAIPANICLGCGLCCDGTMFSRPPPVFEDAATGRIRPEGGGPALLRPPGPAQPCPAHHAACTIHRERPGACRAYECALRLRLMAGEVTHETATAVIARALTLRDRVREALEAVTGAHAGAGLNDLGRRPQRARAGRRVGRPGPGPGRRAGAPGRAGRDPRRQLPSRRRHRLRGRPRLIRRPTRPSPRPGLPYDSPPRGISSAGRALRWQRRGHRFDPGILHFLWPQTSGTTGRHGRQW